MDPPSASALPAVADATSSTRSLTPPRATGQAAAAAAEGSAKADKSVPPKQKEACVQCRTTKVKCHAVSPDADPHAPCKRCVRLSLECIYQQKKRGRKVGSGRKSVSDANAAESSAAATAASASASLKRKASPSSAAAGKRRARDTDPAADGHDGRSLSLDSASSSESDSDGEGGLRSPPRARRRESSASRRARDADPGFQQQHQPPPNILPPGQALQALSSLAPPPLGHAHSSGSNNSWAADVHQHHHQQQLQAFSFQQQQQTQHQHGLLLPDVASVGVAGTHGGGRPLSAVPEGAFGSLPSPSIAGGAPLTPSYAAGDGSRLPMPQLGGLGPRFPHTPPISNVLNHQPPTQHLHLPPQDRQQQPQQQAPPLPLYLAHIQPSWSDSRSAVNRGVVRSGGGTEDPYGFPPPAPPPRHPLEVQQQMPSQGTDGFLNGGLGVGGGPTSSSAPFDAPLAPSSSSVPTDPLSRPSPTASQNASNANSDTPTHSTGHPQQQQQQQQQHALRHLLNHPSPAGSATGKDKDPPHTIVGLTMRRAESSQGAGGGGGSSVNGGASGSATGTGNRVTAGTITGVIPMSVKEVLSGGQVGGAGAKDVEDELAADALDGGAGAGDGGGWRAKKRRGIDGLMRHSTDWDTPLEMRILSEEDVFELFDFFHTKLNVLVDVLDAALHTPLFVRRTSAILFTAILTVAARFRRPSLYRHLLKMANNMLGRAFAEGVVEVGLVQSLALLAFWKEADDRGTWRRVGYAIRLALEMDLHHPNMRPLPEDEEEARRVLDRERTFIQLIAFDNTLYLQSSRPKMIPPEYTRHVARWASDHPDHFCLSDAMLSASIQNQEIFTIVGACRASSDRLLKGQLFESAEGLVRAWKETWLTGTPRSGALHPGCKTMLTFYCLLTDFEMALLKQSLQSFGVEADDEPTVSPEEITAFAESVGAALRVLRYMVTDLKEFLPYTQDTVVFGSASTASWLSKNLRRMHRNARQESLVAIQGAMHLFKSISQGEDAFSYQVQFLRSLLLVATRTMANHVATAPPTPGGASQAAAGKEEERTPGGTHLQPPMDVNQPIALGDDATPSFSYSGMVDLSPSALDSSLVAPDASIDDIINNWNDLFPFLDPNVGGPSFDGTQTPNNGAAFVGSSFPSF